MGADGLHRALIELCVERGFDQVSVEDLCRHAGLDREQFDARYSDLEACFAGALEECAEEFTIVESSFGGEPAQLVRDRVLAMLASFVDDGRHEPTARESISDATAAAINGAVFHHMRVAIENNESGRFEDVLPELMYAAVLPYLGPDAAAEELAIRPPVPTRSPG